jgi:hypothetical protein
MKVGSSYMGFAMVTAILARSRVEYFEKLMEGDMVAWSCLIGAIVLSVVVGIIKRKIRGRQQV